MNQSVPITDTIEGLTYKQRLFVSEYLIDKNMTQAAIRAGYSEKSARSTGPELMKNPVIRREIERKLAKVVNKNEQNAQSILDDLFDLKEISMGRKSRPKTIVSKDGTVKTVQVKEFDPQAANRALELYGKELGMFKDKTEHSVADETMKAFFDGIAPTLGPPKLRRKDIKDITPEAKKLDEQSPRGKYTDQDSFPADNVLTGDFPAEQHDEQAHQAQDTQPTPPGPDDEGTQDSGNTAGGMQ